MTATWTTTSAAQVVTSTLPRGAVANACWSHEMFVALTKHCGCTDPLRSSEHHATAWANKADSTSLTSHVLHVSIGLRSSKKETGECKDCTDFIPDCKIKD